MARARSVPDRDLSPSLSPRSTPLFFKSLRPHRAQEVGEPPARLIGIALLERLELGDTVDPEIAEILATLAPGAPAPAAAA